MNTLIHSRAEHQVEDIIRTRIGSYIFHGARSMGKYTVALELSRRLNCTGDDTGPCPSCLQHDSGNYPDLLIIRPESRPSILIEQVRELQKALSLSLYNPKGSRLVIIDDAHTTTRDAQNALLKLIEEPPDRTVFLLVTDQPSSLLTTVHSRCGHVYFPPVPLDQIVSLLSSLFALKPEAAKSLAVAADGAPGLAITLAQSPEEAASRLQLEELAGQVRQKNLFDRLLMTKRLLDSKADVDRFGKLLHRRLIASFKQTDSRIDAGQVNQLSALETFRRSLSAGVSARVALEQLMLEL